jgi:EAL domain-containing protein (putative c-di-GMP-specific phosphodiesterase class I)
MNFAPRSTFLFALRIVLPVLLVLAGSIMFMIFALNEMAGEVDRIDRVTTTRSAHASLKATLKRLHDVHGDYAVWDDAATALYGAVDFDFAERNFRESTRSGIFFDSAFLLDERGQPVFSYRRGGVAPRGPLEEFGTPLQVLMTELARNYTSYDAKVGLMKDRSGAIATVAVGSVYPASSTEPRRSGRPRLLVLAHTLDDVIVRRMGREFTIDGMALRFNPDYSGQGVQLTDPTGRAIGALTWQNRNAETMAPALVEALLRWDHPQHGAIPPDLFISVAEEMGLMDELGTWVLRHACRDAVGWPSVRLAVNVSAVQFRNPGFDRILATTLSESGLPPERLEVELTETSLVTYPDRAQHIVAVLRALGVTVALDDFGTGYSSIGYLRRFAFDKLKIDRSLVNGVSVDPETRRLCEATVRLGLALDLYVTAEGLETESDMQILRAAGCSHLQGYYFHRPMTADAVTELLQRTASPEKSVAAGMRRAKRGAEREVRPAS